MAEEGRKIARSYRAPARALRLLGGLDAGSRVSTIAAAGVSRVTVGSGLPPWVTACQTRTAATSAAADATSAVWTIRPVPACTTLSIALCPASISPVIASRVPGMSVILRVKQLRAS